jgi:mRNA interferase RelE/StbE
VTSYTIRYTRTAEKEIEGLPAVVVPRINDAINRLADNPRPHGAIKLKGFANKYRIRVGSYRVLYEIHDANIVVLIIQVVHRKDAYR